MNRRCRPRIFRHALPGFSLARACLGGETRDMARVPIIPARRISVELRPDRSGSTARQRPGTRISPAIRRALGRVAGLMLALCCVGCAVPSITVGAAGLSARPNPSPDGSYAVRWTPITGASAYRLLEDGAVSYEGPALSRAYADKPAGAYTYSLTYCVAALGVTICDLRPGFRDLTVTVSSE